MCICFILLRSEYNINFHKIYGAGWLAPDLVDKHKRRAAHYGIAYWPVGLKAFKGLTNKGNFVSNETIFD